MWNGIAGTAPYHGYNEDRHLEEGELQPSVILEAQLVVTNLQGLLRTHVGNILGIPMGDSNFDAVSGQATLASVIARAQVQNLPLKIPQDQPPAVSHLPPTSSSAHTVSAQQPTVDHTQTRPTNASTPTGTLSLYGLSDEQTKMLEQAIVNAASAAQAQAEAEAAMEEEEEEDYEEEE